MRRRLRSIIGLVGVLVLPVVTALPAGAVAGFGDVADGEFYTEAVQWMVDHEITSGTSPGCFSPGNATSRGQVATFIHRAHGAPAGGSSGFVDVARDAYYAAAIGWMVDAGITTGTTPSTFAPDRLVTRGELATFLHRAAGSPAGGNGSFVDVGPDDFFADAVGWMVAEGITTGTSATTFSPHRFVTRGEVATFLHRAAGSPAVSVDPGLLFDLVRAGFGQRRKMLRRSLAALVGPDAFEIAGVAPTARAEELGLHDWASLVEAVAVTG